MSGHLLVNVLNSRGSFSCAGMEIRHALEVVRQTSRPRRYASSNGV
jgi:hypothetical protein